MFEIIVLAFLAIVVAVSVPVYNRFSSLREMARNTDATFDAMLLRKNGLADKVAELANQIAIHDRATHEAIARASQEAAKEMAKSIHPTIVLANLSVRFPELRHFSGFSEAQRAAISLEQQIDASLTHRNYVVNQYNEAIVSFPEIIVAKVLGFEKLEYRGDVSKDMTSFGSKTAEIPLGKSNKKDDIEKRLAKLIGRN